MINFPSYFLRPLKRSSFGTKQCTLKPIFTTTLAQLSMSITVTGATIAQARGSEGAHNLRKSVSLGRTNGSVLLALGLMLMSTGNLLL